MRAEDRPDKPKEACGVFAVYAPDEDVSRLTYFGLYALQHRGQESAGIATTFGGEITCYKDMGLVNLVFTEKILRLLKGKAALGHIRYSTTGSSVEANAQPVVADGVRHVAVAHNGNLVNTNTLRCELEANGCLFSTTSDTEVIAKMIAESNAPTLEEAVRETLPKLKGAFSVGILSEGKLIGARDPHGNRPLCIGSFGDGKWVLSSETCALSIIGAEFFREVEPGEIVVISDGKLSAMRYSEPARTALCIFEFIYFARPDSIMMGKTLNTCRGNMGKNIARQAPVDADIVFCVPDSGSPAAIGYAAETGIPYDIGFVKNRYVGRTFIQPDQSMRDLGIRMKLNPLGDNIKGKRIILVDDSIVRGTTSSKIVKMLYHQGAKEVHVRVSSPPIKYPCFYGIDMATREELLASNRTVEDIRQFIGCDSLEYLNINGLFDATGLDKSNFCAACFNEDYPVPIPQQLPLDKLLFEQNGRKNGKK
jgi:amidophosphoribosyltransferase